MKGYFKDPEATAQTIRENWIWTGDNAYQDSDGFFYFVDRAKDMIKRAGENVAASEVEAVIQQHPKVFDCAVIGVPDPLRDEAIKAFVVLHANEEATAEEIIEWCRARLAKFRVPEFVEFCQGATEDIGRENSKTYPAQPGSEMIDRVRKVVYV